MSECAFVCTSRYSFVFVASMPSTPSPTLTCDNQIKLKIYFIMHKLKHNNPISHCGRGVCWYLVNYTLFSLQFSPLSSCSSNSKLSQPKINYNTKSTLLFLQKWQCKPPHPPTPINSAVAMMSLKWILPHSAQTYILNPRVWSNIRFYQTTTHPPGYSV